MSGVLQWDAQGRAKLLFGDGENGMVPPQGTSAAPVTVTATYRIGGGVLGNVSAGTEFRSSLSSIRRAVNIAAAGGGTAAENVQRAASFAPRLYRSQERAVTAGDYRDLALQVPGVGKALAVAAGWNHVVLFVAPTGQVAAPTQPLRRDLLAFLEGRRMATTAVTVLGPTPADIYIRANVQAQPYYLQSDIETQVEKAVAAYFAFDAIRFGEPVYLSRIYDAIQSLPQVASVFVTQFSRSPGGGVEGEGTIVLEAHELPRPGYRDNVATPPNPLDPSDRPPIVLTLTGGVAS